MSKFHNSAAWGRLRARLVAEARRTGAPCQICGMPIDWTRSGRHPWGPSADHIIGAAVAPELALDPTNVRIVHARCNRVPRAREVIAQGRAVHGLDAPQSAAVATQPATPAPWTPEPWARAYAAFLARESPGGHPSAGLHNSRPWLAPWTIADYNAGRVSQDGRLLT